uniref:PIN domain-containing protein n=1 Tax=Candidatus Kentrum sp. FM TaxID=2126340 RepID=A0A450VVV3_9GAMM|nr:MAG: hypothetical protein BECKFM1743A_GA0114220_101224 [Candidatus Kentron sp. FM]VFJ54798.1 MAG: hypothetical protein BECKFM1743C_GA0114222_101444 [Candidatus Kentron sp. FM]VFK08900.1 MAG: hypothetical protein BECKFM1743B_GA0114221_100854 [Candidatus Kentron sp. FM]
MVSAYFLDTSALVKKYMTETGSGWIEALTDFDSNNRVLVARVTWVETISAFSRLRRENKIDPVLLDRTIRIFETDWETEYRIVEIEGPDFDKAGDLVQKHPLRAYDAIQLACALKVHAAFAGTAQNSVTFLSGDNRLIDAARSEGLEVENPNNHP